MQLKTRGIHLTCKGANKCLNVFERVEAVESNKNGPLVSSDACELSVFVK